MITHMNEIQAQAAIDKMNVDINSDHAFIVVYRTGTKESFRWLPDKTYSHDKAYLVKRSFEKRGTVAYVYKYEEYLSIGGPDTFE